MDLSHLTERRSSRARRWAAAVWLAAPCLVAHHASAQVINTYFPALVGSLAGDSVLARTQPEYTSLGVQAGSFTIRPRVEEGLGYDSNVDGAPHGHGSAEIASHASIGADSNWSRNSLNAYIGVDDLRYLSRAVQDETDWTASVGGAYDIGRDRLSASYTHLALTQAPGDIGAQGLSTKQPYSVDDVRLTYNIVTHSALSFTPDFEFRNYQFSSTVLANGVSNAVHNRTTEQAELTTRYEFSPERNALLVVRGTRADYDNTPAGAISGNSNALTILAGLDYAATGVFRYRALVGYQFREFDSRQVSNLSEPIVEGAVIWSPTRLTTVSANIRRDIEDAADESLAGFTYTAARVAVTHELQRNVLLNGSIEWQHGDYRATPVTLVNSNFAQFASSQDVYGGTVSGTVLLNRNLRATASYGLTLEHSAGSYVRNAAIISLGFGL